MVKKQKKKKPPRQHIRRPEGVQDVLCGNPPRNLEIPPLDYPSKLPPEGPDQCGSCRMHWRRHESNKRKLSRE